MNDIVPFYVVISDSPAVKYHFVYRGGDVETAVVAVVFQQRTFCRFREIRAVPVIIEAGYGIFRQRPLFRDFHDCPVLFFA